jgi:hypothetical protein
MSFSMSVNLTKKTKENLKSLVRLFVSFVILGLLLVILGLGLGAYEIILQGETIEVDGKTYQCAEVRE